MNEKGIEVGVREKCGSEGWKEIKLKQTWNRFAASQNKATTKNKRKEERTSHLLTWTTRKKRTKKKEVERRVHNYLHN